MDKCVNQWKSKCKHYFIMVNCHWLLIPKGQTPGLAVNPLRDRHALYIDFILKDEVGTDEKPRKVPRPLSVTFGSHPRRPSFAQQRNTTDKLPGETFWIFKMGNRLTLLSKRRAGGKKFDSLFVLSEQSPGLETIPLILQSHQSLRGLNCISCPKM